MPKYRQHLLHKPTNVTHQQSIVKNLKIMNKNSLCIQGTHEKITSSSTIIISFQ